uniref:Putative conserved secreted protein n=1 Tax=Culex tarsalis TaxID=7177 RepID=A0A1Q3FMK2_CULTA
MKLLFVVTLVICCILQYTSGYSRAVANARHSAFPGQCYDGETKTTVKKGFTKYKNCEKYTCGKDYALSVTGCLLTAVPKGCGSTSDMSKKYPDCCPKVVC